MKKTITLVFTGILAAGLLVFVAACSQPSSGGSDSQVHETNDSRVTYQGKDLTVTVEENPTTGYSWAFEIDGSSIKALSDEYVPDETEKDVVGSGGTHTFIFEGTSGGTATINMVYGQSWDMKDDDEKLSVEVTTGSDGTIESANVTTK